MRFFQLKAEPCGWAGAVELTPLGSLNYINTVVAAQTPGYYAKSFSFSVFPGSSQADVDPQSPPP